MKPLPQQVPGGPCCAGMIYVGTDCVSFFAKMIVSWQNQCPEDTLSTAKA